MRKLLLGVALILSVEGAALACSCLGPANEDQKRDFARAIAARAIAVVEVVEIEPSDYEQERPELYRVVRIHVGKPPTTFLLARPFDRWSNGRVMFRLGSTCDAEPRPGKSEVVMLYAPSAEDWNPNSPGDCANRHQALAAKERVLAIGSMCDKLFLGLDGALDLIKEEARKLGKPVTS